MIKFLLDTNVLLWYFWGTKRVNKVMDLLISEDNDVYFSTASLWEVSTKVRKKKLNVDIDKLHLFLKKHKFFELPVNSSYINAYLELPKIHNDPFDHMMLAQAITSPMRLITGDAILAKYSSLVMVI